MIAELISVILAGVGLLHLYPAVGAISGERLLRLYGVSLSDPNLLVLMRHRAVLFGLLGLFLLYAALRPALQPAACIAAFISMASFVLLAWLQGEYNAALAKVVRADIAGCLALLAAIIMHLMQSPGGHA